jgi:hypothetical protein
MRALLVALALLLLAPPGWALAPLAPEPAVACIPESLVCAPLQVLCPRLGGTFGWCVAAEPERDGLAVVVVVGNWYGPRAGALADAAWADADGDGLPGVTLGTSASTEACLLVFAMVVEPWPALPCAEQVEGSLSAGR